MPRGDSTARKRLVGPAPLAALLAAAAAGLVALHLEARGWWRTRGEPARDAVALAHLRALVERHPGDADLRQRLVREELALGQTSDAERTLAPLLEPQPSQGTAGLLALDVALAAWRATPGGSPARTAAREVLCRRLTLLVERSEAQADLARLAAVAREVGRPELAARAGERAAALDPARCAGLLSQAAKDLLAAADPGSAAVTWERAYGCAADPGEARALGLAVLDAYLAANRGAQALRFADTLAGRFPTDRVVLRRGEEIALAESDPDRARRFGARRVELGGADAALLRRQLDLTLAAGELGRAADLAVRLVDQAPGDRGVRLTAARVATWAGRHALALRHWTWLARRGAPGSAAQGLALARALRDDAALAELLSLESRTRPLPAAALAELADALERLGAPGRAVAALEHQTHRHPGSRDAWEALAELHERRRDLTAALAAREQLVRRFGPSPDASVALARLHRALGDANAALAELGRWQTSADPADVGYWELLGELAWSSGSDAIAARAYRTLWEGDRIDPLGTERLFLLARRAGRTDDAIRYGREGWRRAREPRFLLLAMDEAARARRWGELAHLAGEAERAETTSTFGGFVAYWLLRARLDEERGRPARAAAHYRRALAQDPTSSAARSGLLWLLVATGEREALARQLATWRADAELDPGLWRAYAGGLEALGRRREALAFHERVARAEPSDREAQERLAAALRPRDVQPRATVAVEGGVESFGPLGLQRIATSARSELGGTGVELRAGVTRLTAERSLPLRGEVSELALRATRPMLGGRTELSAVLGRRGGDVLPGGALAHTRSLAGRFEGRLEGAFDEPAAESAALVAEGVRRRVAGALTVSAGAAYGRAAAAWRSFTTRDGTWLAAGGSGALELGVRARAADPELRLRLLGEHQRYDVTADPPPAISALAQGGPLLPGALSMVGAGAAIAGWRLGPTRLSADGWVGWMTPPLRPAYRLQAALSVLPTRRTELSVAGFAANDRWDLGQGGLGVTLSIAHHFYR